MANIAGRVTGGPAFQMGDTIALYMKNFLASGTLYNSGGIYAASQWHALSQLAVWHALYVPFGLCMRRHTLQDDATDILEDFTFQQRQAPAQLKDRKAKPQAASGTLYN